MHHNWLLAKNACMGRYFQETPHSLRSSLFQELRSFYEIVYWKLLKCAKPPLAPNSGNLGFDRQSILESFFKALLSPKDSHNVIGEKVERLVDSFSQDSVHVVSRGKFLTPKHAAVGLGLHILTGQKLPITILAILGHSISYDTVNEIETAQAELVENCHSSGLSLPIQPAADESKVSQCCQIDFCFYLTRTLYQLPGIGD